MTRLSLAHMGALIASLFLALVLIALAPVREPAPVDHADAPVALPADAPEDPAERASWLATRSFELKTSLALDAHAASLAADDTILLGEMLAFERTLEVLARWQASEARRLALDAPRVDGGIESHLVLLGRAEELLTRFMPLAVSHLGTSPQYLADKWATFHQQAARLMAGGALLARETGDTARAERFSRRATSWHRSTADNVRALADVGAEWWPDTEQQRATAKPLADIIAERRASPFPRVGSVAARIVTSDDELRLLAREANMTADDSVRRFAHSFLERYHDGRLNALVAYLPPGQVLDEAHARDVQSWVGWRLREVTPYMLVTPERGSTLSVTVPYVVLENDAGDLWVRECGMLLEELSVGRYYLLEVGTAAERRDSRLTPLDVLRTRLAAEQHRATVEQLRTRPREELPDEDGETPE